ncbi:MAG: IPT/TIG domain-containing protein, partial [Candidatus Acidiferrum sp.]
MSLTLVSCGSASKVTTNPTQPATQTVSVAVSPPTANIRAGSTYAFSATVSGSSNTGVTWSVNSTPNGNSSLGTIDSTGNYSAPSTLPSPNTITVTATSAADSTKSSSSAVTLWNPTPALTGISPAAANLGNFSLTLSGTNFINGAEVLFNNTALTTTFISSTQLTATGTASTAGTFPITVQNPNPGSSASSAINFQVNGATQTSSCSQMSTGQGAGLGGFVPFPSDNLWNKDISSATVDPNSANIINFIGPTIGIHPDFGQGEYNGSYMGIPYTVVD